MDPKRNKEGSRRIYIDEKCRWYCIAASLKDAKEGRGKFYKLLIWAEFSIRIIILFVVEI
jgi:hypothetical protein